MGISRSFFAALFLALTVSVVNAYTVVMRDGRRVEIPNEFTVTNSTLTYQVGNGIQITVQLNTVDIAATERANGQPAGSFLQKAAAPKDIPKAPQGQPSAQRSITNKDLEVYRQARVQNDMDYEKRRKELGLPSAEERRQEVAAIQDRTLEQVRSMRAQEEAYWRSRAEALRAEAALNEAQNGSLYQQPEFPAFWPLDTIGFGSMDGPFGRFRRFPSSSFSGFLSTPITPFPTFRSSPFSGFLSTPITPFPRFPFTPIFRGHGVRIHPRPGNMRHGHR